MKGSVLPREMTVDALEALIRAGDRIVLEGDNQKQADFLARSLVKMDAEQSHFSGAASSQKGRFITQIITQNGFCTIFGRQKTVKANCR
jgi:hypothetical protein